MIVSWLLFPAVLLAVLVGCGLLVRGLVDRPVPGALVPGMGFAVVTCVGMLTTAFAETAELTTPVVVALAVAGYIGAWPIDWRGWRATLPAAAAGVGVFLVYGAPVILSGDATFAGYIKLDDSATWLALTDRVMEHGRSLEGLAPSTYEATLAFNLGGSYPVGPFLALGVGSELVATDTAWTIQPYMSLLAGILAATMVELARPLVNSAWLRAAAAFVAAQSAVLVGYVLWGGIKEIEGALLITVAAALAPLALERGSGLSSVVPLALASAALLGVLSFGGAVWFLLVLLVPLVVLWVRAQRSTRGAVMVLLAIAAVILLPLAAAGKLVSPDSSPLWSASELGNLFEPLSVFQVFGIWPVGDFRLRPDEEVITAILAAAAAAAAVTSAVTAWRRGSVGLLLYWGGAAVGASLLFVVGSPWIDGKAIAMASPAIALAAALGIAVLFERGLRIEACIAGLLIAGGVFVSNYMGYRDVNLAPRDQLGELESIGKEYAGEGPALMTEYNPYGARHFLRDLDAEGASELRRNLIPLATGEAVEKGEWADTDAFPLSSLYPYRTLVLRRSPAQSRPPLPYRLVRSGHYYDVWQRTEEVPPPGYELLPLGSETDPIGRGRCADVEQLASLAGTDGALAYVEGVPNVVVAARNLDHPDSWPSEAEFLIPREAGTASATVDLPQTSRWTIWLGGSVRGRMEVRVDGEEVGSARAFLNNKGLYVPLGSAELPAGRHTVEIAYSGADLHPGSGGSEAPIGPLILQAGQPEREPVRLVPASQSDRLCGRPADWIQAVPAEAVTAARSSP